jgi:type IV secretory pathway VirB10-like protein
MIKRAAVLALAVIAAPSLRAQEPADSAPPPAQVEAPKPAAPKAAPRKALARPKTAAKPAPSTPAPEPESPPVAPPAPLLGFCAVPVRPACIESSATYAEVKTKAACNQDMDRYVKSVFTYRMCLNAEMERAVRQTNEAIFRHRCRMTGKKNCP